MKYHNSLSGKYDNIINSHSNNVKTVFKTNNNSIKTINYKTKKITNKTSIMIIIMLFKILYAVGKNFTMAKLIAVKLMYRTYFVNKIEKLKNCFPLPNFDSW